jgi:uncharacterized protein (TIRG00374 family)
MRKFQSLLLKLSVTCVVLWLVLREVELDRLVASLRSMDPSYLPWLMLLTVSARAIMAAKWNMFLRLGGVCVGLPRLFRIVLLSDFYMLLFPMALTAEAIRLLLLKLQGYSLTMSASATLADRLLGLIVLAGVSALGVAMAWDSVAPRLGLAICGAVGLMWLSLLLVVSRSPFAKLVRVAGWLLERAAQPASGASRLGGRVLDVLQRMHNALVGMFKRSATLGVVCLLQILILTMRILMVHLLFRSLGAEVPILFEVAFVPVIDLLTMLPISLMGLGVREAAFIYFFDQVGLDPSIAVAASLLGYAIVVPMAVACGIVSLFVGPRVPRPGLLKLWAWRKEPNIVVPAISGKSSPSKNGTPAV